MALTPASLSMILSNAIFMAASFISVLLRLWARRQKALPLKADDWLVIAAWLFSALLAITNIVGVPIGGFGVPFLSLSDGQSENFLKVLFILQFWYIIAVALVKLSVLCFYGRIFQLGSWPLVIRVFIALVIGWLISFLFATFFQIWPLWCNWIACTPTSNYALMYALCSATDIILDICILAIPISFIRRLQMSNNQKLGIVAIFGLGIFCVVASCARLAYTVLFVQVNIAGNYAVNFDTAVVNIIMWSGIEANASTICANLPTYRPLVGKFQDMHILPGNMLSLRGLYGTPSRPSAAPGWSGSSSDGIIHGVPMANSRGNGAASSSKSPRKLHSPHGQMGQEAHEIMQFRDGYWEQSSKAEAASSHQPG